MQNPTSKKPVKSAIWTYRPPQDVIALFAKIISKLKPKARHGLRSRLISEALRARLSPKVVKDSND